MTREEQYLAYLTGNTDVVLPQPITRKEQYLYKLCMAGGGATKEQLHQIEQNKADIKQLSEEIADLGGKVIPDYWQTHLSEKIARIKALQDEGGKDCFSYIVITDIHYEKNLGKLSVRIARKIAKECGIKFILILGDLQDRSAQKYTREQALSEWDNINAMIYDEESDYYIYILVQSGNHDGSYSTNNAFNLTPQEIQERIFRKVGLIPNIHFDESGTGYYIDDAVNKVRFIMLNSHCNKYELNEDGTAKYGNLDTFRFTQSQYDMVIEALTTIPSNEWHVIPASHVPLDRSGEYVAWGGTVDENGAQTGEPADCVVMMRMLNAYVNKTSYSGSFVGTQGGEAGYTNLADTSSADWASDSRLNSSGAIDSTAAGRNVTNYISYTEGDILKVKGLTFYSSDRFAVYDADKNRIYLGAGSALNSYITTNEDGSWSLDTSVLATHVNTAMEGGAYIRLPVQLVDGETPIITTGDWNVTSEGFDTVSVDVDFSNAKGTLISYHGGHVHKDIVWDKTYSWKGAEHSDFPIISTRCDAREENEDTLLNERVVDTTTEQSFDVFTVNKATGKIYATKIGAGEDREITIEIPEYADFEEEKPYYAKEETYSKEEVDEKTSQLSEEIADLNLKRFDNIFAPLPQLSAGGKKDGYTTPLFTNLIASDFSNCTLNGRWSVSGGKVSTANGYVLLDMIPVTIGDVIRINLPAENFGKDYSKIMFYNAGGTLLNDGYNAANDPYIDLDTSGEVAVITVGTVNSGTPANVRISLYISASAITNADLADLIVTKNQEIKYEVIEPSEEPYDFNADECTTQNIYDFVDSVVEKYPSYITKETMGKDASGVYDCNRYILSKKHYMAWQRENYPRMYAWTNGSTTIYSVSVSPRLGDTLYSTAYIGTAKGTVTAVDNANRTRTVGGVVYTQDRTKDIEPTLVYTTILQEIVGDVNVKSNSVGANITSADGTKLARIASAGSNTITSNHSTPITYIRYPFGDLNYERKSIPKVVIWANEHGGLVGDSREPAILMTRFINDLCSNVANDFIRYIKNNLMMIIIPVANPYGFDYNVQDDGGYYNSNGVNINRNYDTPGWINSPQDAGGLGEYGGSENETQYMMNTMQDSKAVVGMSLHTLGYLTETGETSASDGLCAYQGNGFDAEKIARIAEVMKSNYNLDFIDYGTADPTADGKSPAYITYAGAKGGLVEMSPREGISPSGTQHSALVMEACYTEFLQCLYMWLTDYKGTVS